MPNHDRFECQTAIDSDAILHRMLTIQRPECMEGFIMDTGKQLSFNGENTVFCAFGLRG